MTSVVTASARNRAQTRQRWELLTGLIRKDLKVKYQGSVLGFLWSLVNPLVLLVVYTFVFQVVLGSGIPRFGYYLLSGLLIWNAFSGSVSMATDAVVANAGLVKKVRFPLGVLPLAAVGFNIVHYGLQTLVLLTAMTLTGDTDFIGVNLLLLVPAFLVAMVFTTGMSFLVASLNVRYRDTKHLVEIILMAGFWVSPIVYSVSLVASKLHGSLYDAYYFNPMTAVVVSSQRAIYGRDVTLPPPATTTVRQTAVAGTRVLADPGTLFYLERLGIGLIVSAFILALGLRTFYRMSADFAEEL